MQHYQFVFDCLRNKATRSLTKGYMRVFKRHPSWAREGVAGFYVVALFTDDLVTRLIVAAGQFHPMLVNKRLKKYIHLRH